MKKVSIVIPTYNVEKYLRECLESAVNQNFESFEIIAVNDGSTDNSRKILGEYEKKYDFFKVIDQENKGLSGARNTGLYSSNGEYIYFLDSDDYIDLNTIKLCYEECSKNNLDIINFDALSFWDDSNCKLPLPKSYDRKNKIDNKVYKGTDYIKELIKNDGYRASICLNFYKREFLIKNDLIFEEGYIHEDEIFTLDAYCLAERIKYIDNKLFYRRLRENSITTSNMSINHLKGRVRAAEKYESYILNDKYSSDFKKQMSKYAQNLYYWILVDTYIMEKGTKSKVELKSIVIRNIKKNKELLSAKLYIQMYFPKTCFWLRNLKNKKGL